MPSAINEVLRYDAPSPIQGRYTLREAEMHGTTIPQHSIVAVGEQRISRLHVFVCRGTEAEYPVIDRDGSSPHDGAVDRFPDVRLGRSRAAAGLAAAGLAAAAEVFGLNKSPRLNLPGDADGAGLAAAASVFVRACLALGKVAGDAAGDAAAVVASAFLPRCLAVGEAAGDAAGEAVVCVFLLARCFAVGD